MNIDFKHRINAGRVALENQIEFFRSQFGKVDSQWKEDATRVTFADFAISEKIIMELKKSFPDDDFCSEESTMPEGDYPLNARYAWVIDPIDGTNNYALGLPMCAISLGLLKDGYPVYGFVYEFARDVLLHGGAGVGLFEGTHKIVVEDVPLTQKESLLAMQFPLPDELLESYLELLRTYRVRSIGSGTMSLAYSALGKFDGVYDHKCKVWDIAASAALAQASGQTLHFTKDSPFPLKVFSTKAPQVPYYSGSAAFCEKMQSILT